jgi:hypothetical protein
MRTKVQMRLAQVDGGMTMSKIPWESNYETALERARSERKFVFLDVFNPG